jgi:uncharacterized protein YkwD
VRLARLAAGCLMLLMLALPSAAQGNRSSEHQMISQINKVRASHGLHRLARSNSLQRSSGRFAAALMSSDTFAHRARISASGRFRALGEALAMRSGTAPNARAALRSWLHSSAHRKIVLSSRASRLGVGVASGNFRGSAAQIWVLQVGRPR